MTDSELLLALSEMIDKKLNLVNGELKEIKQDVISTRLHLENVTDKNISI